MLWASRSFLLFPLVAAAFGLALLVVLPQLFLKFLENASSVLSSTIALCATFLAQVPLLSFLSTGCLVACVFALSVLSGTMSCLQQLRRTRRFVERALAHRLYDLPANVVPLAERLDVVATSEPLAFCYGLRQPRICISVGLIDCLPPEELEAVILHERQHLTQRDPQRILFVRTVTAAFFYLPVLKEVEKHFLVCAEVEADRSAIERMGSRRYLAAALHRLLSGVGGRAPDQQLAVGPFDATQQRLDHLVGRGTMTQPQFRSPHVFMSLASVTALVTALAWMLSGATIPGATCVVSDAMNGLMALAPSGPSLWATLLSSVGCLALLALAPRHLLRS